MNGLERPFNFDVNFGFGKDSVFTDGDNDYLDILPPPVDGYFLLTDQSNFLLTDLTNLLLA